MNRLVIVSTLFVLGSLAGYVLEVFYRRFFSAKKWINPGFLVGPYIPLYGFGVMLLYGLSNLDFAGVSGVPEHLLRVAVIGVSLTLIEFVTGVIFIRGLHIKLWDYSDRFGNVMGVICPLFSVLWFLLGSGYYFFLNARLVSVIEWLGENPIYSYSVGLVVGMMIVDACYSIRLGIRIRTAADQFVVRYEQFKLDLKREALERADDSRFYGTLVAIFRVNNTLRDVIAQRRTIDGNSTAEEADAQENLMGQVAARLNVVVEKYPELKANENYATAMEAVDRYTNMVRTSKMVYNDTATKYNKLIRQIPDSFVAAMFGFKTRDYLKTEEKKADMPSLKI